MYSPADGLQISDSSDGVQLLCMYISTLGTQELEAYNMAETYVCHSSFQLQLHNIDVIIIRREAQLNPIAPLLGIHIWHHDGLVATPRQGRLTPCVEPPTQPSLIAPIHVCISPK